ncbi:SIS domain-containing protein [Micromonospora sp. NBC_01412]|uniref:SIS domain-containing protein n=1 Tax=Micromonospora sp. NBC_01412 TaxID=2903590 RepID=UPI0032543DA3
MTLHPFAAALIEGIARAIEEQDDLLRSTALVVAEKVRSGGVLHVFGSGHSHLITEELFTRAAGVTFISPVFDPALMVTGGYERSTRTERLHGYAEAVLAGADLREHDIVLIVSNSGRNAVPVEAALFSRKRGCFVIGLTSVQHSASVESRHRSGKKLADVVDVVLDSHAPAGDAVLEVGQSGDRYGPTSTILGAAVAHTLLCLVVEELVRLGEEPPVLRSANLDDSDNVNALRKARYVGRIPGLGGPAHPTTAE